MTDWEPPESDEPVTGSAKLAVTEAQARAALQSIGVKPSDITSTYRTPEENTASHGAKHSLHLVDGAIDFRDLPKGMTPEKFKAKMSALGMPVTEFMHEKKGDPNSTGDHYHWGFAPKGDAEPQTEDDDPQTFFKRNSAWVKGEPKTDYLTHLSAQEEGKFQQWVKSNKVPFDGSKTADYDMRGFWKALQAGDPQAKSAVDPNDKRLHYPDYWKTPYHKTFSDESQWADPKKAPAWNDKDQLVGKDGAVIFDDRAQQAQSNTEQPWQPPKTDTVAKPSRLITLVAQDVSRETKDSKTGILDRIKNAFIAPVAERDKSQSEAWSKGFWGIPDEIGKEFAESAAQTWHAIAPTSNIESLQDALDPIGHVAKVGLAALGMPLSPLTGTLTSQIGRPVEQETGIRREITGGVLSALVPLGAAEDASAASKMAANLSRNAPSALEKTAVQTVLKRIAQDTKTGAPTAQHALDLVAAANKAGKPMTLADVGGENVNALLGAVGRAPGESRNLVKKFLEQRDEGAGKRLSADVDKGIGMANRTAFATADALSAARAAHAAPLYKDAFAANQNIQSPMIDRILETPAGKRALSSARVKMRNDMTAMGVPDKEIAEQLREAGEPVPKGGVASGLKLRTLDYVKRSMDDQIGVARRAGKNDDVRILTGLKNSFVSALDTADVTARAGPNSLRPEGGLYKQARAAYSGPSRSLDAIEEGKAHFNKSPEESAAEIANLSPGDKEFYKLGAADALKKKLLSTGRSGDESRKVVGNQWIRDQLRPLFNSEGELKAFVDSATAETKMFDTKTKAIGNSLTAARQAEDRSGEMAALAHGATALGHASSGNYLGTLMSAYKMKRELSALPNPALNHAIANIILGTDTESPGLKLLRDFSLVAPKTRSLLTPPPAMLRRAPAINALTQLAPQSNQP